MKISDLQIFRAALVCMAAFIVRVPASQPGEAFADFTNDGGWCWFSDPRAVSRDGKTFTGWVTEDGSIEAACLDHATRKVTTATLHEKYERDDHNNPSFLFLPDGRLRAFYTKHSRVEEINSRVTKRPGDISEWEPEVTIVPKDANPKRSGITYSNPFMLSEEDNAIYLLWRGRTYKPTMAKSVDGGETWSDAAPVFSMPGLPPGNRPYAKYASNGKDRIHMLFTDGHPRNEATNSVYYVCYRAGAFYKADGTRICGVNELSIRPEQADKIYDATPSGARGWIWEVAFDAKDQPVVVYTRHPSEKDHRYHYARWNGGGWDDSELCAAGDWFPQTPEGKTEPEPHYTSGIALDPKDPSIVYLTRPVDGVRELEKWTTADGGKSWKQEAVTSGSKHDNIRPYVVRDHSADGPTVLWQNLSERYVHYTNYRCSIKMDRPSEVARGDAPELPALSAAIEPEAVLKAMERVADWQLANPSAHKPTDWTQGAGYAGIMALSGISADSKYRDAMVAMGEANRWSAGPRVYHADDHCVGQTYAELYFQTRERRMIEPMRARFDEILANPREGSLEFKTPGNQDRWSWCDALFMAPPAWLRMYVATDDTRYLDLAVNHWWRTSDYLYDKEESLYYRDSTYFEKREKNGAKVFWGRGNGWVMGGLVRMLQYLPANHPERPRFVKQYQDMCAKLLTCQQDDGLWRASLLDPAGYPLKETSSSGFFAYAFAWGVNQRLLERKSYEPAVRKAWAALVSCVENDGKLTHVQPIGEDPRNFPDDSTEIYGVGAFLLAGSETYRMAVLENTKPVVVHVTNPSDIRRVDETVEVAAGSGNPVVMDGLTSRVLASQVVGDKLLFQVDLAAGDTRHFLVLSGDSLAAVPPADVKTFCRFVPERMDDFAWESDRTAHRMYGPALITGEGTVSSGVDVWVKRTRGLVMNKWYKAGDYHSDHGEGLDGYSVAHNSTPTRGCGGLGIWDEGKLYVSSNFKTQKVIATGPIRSEFELTYDAWDANGRMVSEVKRMSIDAGSNFTRVTSTFTADGKGPLAVGVGVAYRGSGDVANDPKDGWLAYWEPESGKNGHTACALVVPGVKEFTKDHANLLAIGEAESGKPFTYYLGAGWSKSGDFPDAKAWEAYVGGFAKRLRTPFVVTVK